jgi:orotate phosphoribosyltransferase
MNGKGIHDMNQWEVMEIFEREKAVEKGHFLLSSGKHSDTYIQCARVLQYPHQAESLANELAKGFNPVELDLVLSPALGGIIIGYMVALAMRKPMVFAERTGGVLAIRRGLSINKGERILLVEDVITTGGSLRELMELVNGAEANLVGIGALIERGEDRGFEVQKKVLLRLDVSAWDESDCPLCRKGVKLEAPGSRRLA